jgi:N-acyl-D-aspartate/D-glutamate deacylase
MLDLIIVNGTLVDGTGAPGRKADIGVRDGLIAEIAAPGGIGEDAKQTIDASGRIVCPGFVDVHTHYDAQVFWDPTLSPSSFHGVTTIMGGNCGFSIAPLSPEAGDYLMRMLARVEGMPLESLQVGVPWNWESFDDYLGALDGTLAVNAGFMVGHSALRRVVMGERAVGNEATEEELTQMMSLLRESLRAGGLGFSSTISKTHNDADGQPVPSRHASREELIALAGVVSEFPGTSVEFLPGASEFGDTEKQLMTDLSLASGRPVNWNVLAPAAMNAELVENQLQATDYARAQGAEVVALTVPQPMTVRINLHAGFIFDALWGWAELFQLGIEERMERLRDPAYRVELAESAQDERSGMIRLLAVWGNLFVDQVVTKQNEKYVGRQIKDIAKELGKSEFDTMLDISLDDGLLTSFKPPSFGEDDASWELRAKVWQDDRSVIGASDAGAHLDMIDTFAFSTQVLGNGVRKRQLLSLEEAIRQLTDVPARLYGLKQRGRIEESWHADIVVFDPDSIECGETYTRFDLPADAGRLYADAQGIEHVVVNGVEIIRGQEYTGKKPGTILRAGRDTDGVEIPASR